MVEANKEETRKSEIQRNPFVRKSLGFVEVRKLMEK
jgi:hypothetical protein